MGYYSNSVNIFIELQDFCYRANLTWELGKGWEYLTFRKRRREGGEVLVTFPTPWTDEQVRTIIEQLELILLFETP